MGCASRCQYARIKLKAGHIENAKLRIAIASQKRPKRFQRNTSGTRNCDMRMKGLQIRFNTRMKNSILNTPMQGKEMWVPSPNTCPNDGYLSPRAKDTEAAQRQKKRGHTYFAQSFPQAVLRGRANVAEKTERQMKLFFRHPAKTGKMRIQRQKRHLATSRKSEANKKPFHQRGRASDRRDVRISRSRLEQRRSVKRPRSCGTEILLVRGPGHCLRVISILRLGS
jgi:hypothetical protein